MIGIAYAGIGRSPYTGWIKGVIAGKDLQLAFLTKYTKGKKDGPSLIWRNNGRRLAWRKDGKLVSRRYWKDNKKEGLWEKWHENGVKSDSGEVQNGKKSGLATEWDETEAKIAEIHYKNGEYHGGPGGTATASFAIAAILSTANRAMIARHGIRTGQWPVKDECLIPKDAAIGQGGTRAVK